MDTGDWLVLVSILASLIIYNMERKIEKLQKSQEVIVIQLGKFMEHYESNIPKIENQVSEKFSNVISKLTEMDVEEKVNISHDIQRIIEALKEENSVKRREMLAEIETDRTMRGDDIG